MDPLTEKYPNIGAYVYCYQNPVKFVDPDGRVFGDYYGMNGEYLFNDKINDNKVYVLKEGPYRKIDEGTEKTIIKYVTSGLIDLTEKTNITHSEFLDRANWIYAEGGYEIPEYYSYSIENAYQDKFIGNKKEKLVYSYLLQDFKGKLDKDKYISGELHNGAGKDFWEKRDKPWEFTENMKNTISAIIKSKISPEKDPTNGTNSWLGYKSSAHEGEYYILSRGRRHFFRKFGKSKRTNVGRKYIIIP